MEILVHACNWEHKKDNAYKKHKPISLICII